jgi:hypothetical protein
MLDAYCLRYHVTNTARILFALNYFDEADQQPMPELLWDVQWEDIKDTIVQWVREAANVSPADRIGSADF